MFYSAEILSLKSNSNIGVVWLAATLGPKSQARRLTRRDYGNANLIDACKFLSVPPIPLSLRLQSNLMVGIVRVYGQKMGIVYMDVRGLWTKVVNRIAQVESLERQSDELVVETKDITIEKTEALMQVPSIDLDTLLTGLQSTTKKHSSTQLSEIFRHASFSSNAIHDHITTSSMHEGFKSVSEMLPMEELNYPANDYAVPFDEPFLQRQDQHPLIDAEDSQRVPRMSVEKKKRLRSIFDNRIILSRAEMFLTAEEIEEADACRVKRSMQMKEAQAIAFIDTPLLQCPLLVELMPKTIPVSQKDSPLMNYTPYNHDMNHEPVEMLRAFSDSTSNIRSLPWSSFGSVPGSDSRKYHSITTTSEPPPMVPTSSPLKEATGWGESVNFIRFVEEKTGKTSKQTSFQKVIGSNCSRTIVARALYNLLDAATKGMVNVKQSEPYGVIQIMIQS